MGKALSQGKPTYKYYRCQTCGKFLTDSMIESGECLGHKMIFATSGTLWEWLMIKLGVIK